MAAFLNNRPLSMPEHYDQYSDDPATLRALVQDVTIEIHRTGVVPSPWQDGYRAVHHSVTISRDERRFVFSYYGSHNDATAFDNRDRKAARAYREGLLYSVLSCIGGEYSLDECDPEDVGLDPDSIKDVGQWNEIKTHSRNLRTCLRLSDDERNSLPA